MNDKGKRFYSKDGRYMCERNEDGTISIWDMNNLFREGYNCFNVDTAAEALELTRRLEGRDAG